MAPSQSEDSVYIPSITLKVRPESHKTVDYIEFQTKSGSFKKGVAVQVLPDHGYEEVFAPVLDLSVQDRLTVWVYYRSYGIQHYFPIPAELRDVMTNAQDDGHGNLSYSTHFRNVDVTIFVSSYSATRESSEAAPLSSTTIYPQNYPSRSTTEGSQVAPLPITDEILQICPRFRLLVIGNSGVGKSTLIHKVFGVKDVNVSESSRGKADIDREFVAEENGFFVLHDSLGLEAGDSNNFKTIKRFINDRRQRENLMDRLHAVWVCLEVPYADGRLLEAGMEDFLRDRKKILGDIPVVVVLTKIDLLDNSLFMALRKEGITFKTTEEAQPFLEPRRFKFIDEYCAKPLQRITGGGIPHVAVSTQSGYGLERTVPELVKTTSSEIERYIKTNLPRFAGAERPSIERNAQLYIAGMAQRASIEAKVELTIDLGKKRYWTNLGASLTFSPDKVETYLLAIHRDIIQVWNLNDPEMVLQTKVFKGHLLDTSNLGVHEIRDARAILGTATQLVSALVPLVNELMGAIIALPLTGAAILAVFLLEAYRSSQAIVKRFMAYIIHLVYVMKILFILAPQRPITSQDVALAWEVYGKLTYRYRVHSEIEDFNTVAVAPGACNAVVEKIEELIRRYDITDDEVSRLRGQIPPPPAS